MQSRDKVDIILQGLEPSLASSRACNDGALLDLRTAGDNSDGDSGGNENASGSFTSKIADALTLALAG